MSVSLYQVNTGHRLLMDVRRDLVDVVQVCEAKKKQTNYLRSLTSDLAKGSDAPKLFEVFAIPSLFPRLLLLFPPSSLPSLLTSLSLTNRHHPPELAAVHSSLWPDSHPVGL